MIKVEGLTKCYNKQRPEDRVLKNVDLDISSNEVVSIVGTSGSGKSTLLNIIGGLDRDYEGRVSVDGDELKQMSDAQISRFRNSAVGFVFQAFNLLPHLTSGENIALPAYFRAGLGPDEISSRVKDVLNRVNILHKQNDYPDLLSGGERQRVAIARALFNQPKLLLCDEPTGSLDNKTSGVILDLFLGLNRSENITVVLVTHDREISRRADRIVHLEDGEIVDIEITGNSSQTDQRETTAPAEPGTVGG